MSALFALLLAAVAAAPQEGWEGFPVLVWRERYGGRPAPAEVLAGLGGTNVEGLEDGAWARERGLDTYLGHAPGRDALHLDADREWYAAARGRFVQDRDASALVREPCLSEPETLDALRARLRASVAAQGGEVGLALSLGDEVHLTANGSPLDLCASAACRAAWARFAAAHAAELGVELPAGELPYPETDAVRRAWVAGDASGVPLWLLRRRFHQAVVLGVLEELAAGARAAAPGAPVALMGLGGRTAFGGVAVEEALGFLDVQEIYPLSDARELFLTLRAPGQRLLRTCFVERGAPASVCWQAWEGFVRGTDGLVVWSDAGLEDDPASARALRRAVAAMRDLRARGLAPRAAPSGLAVLHEPDSLALAWLRDALRDGPTWTERLAGYHEEHGTREVALRAWLSLAEDAGLQPGAVPLDRVDAAISARFPVLVASHVLLLEDADQARLAGHLERGGHLLVTGPLGRWDRRMEDHGDARLVELEERFPQRVHRAPEHLAGHVAERARPGSNRAEALRRWLGERLGAAGVAAPLGARVAGEDAPPLLQAAWPAPDGGGTLVLLLPNPPASAAGARVAWRPVIDSPPDARVERVWPPGDALVPAGWPLLVRVVAE